MSEFYIVRHGQASFGAANYDKLSQLGHQQAIWLGEYFAKRGISFSAVFQGNMVRHQETTQAIFSKLVSPESEYVELGLNEFDFENITQAYLSLYPEQKLTSDAQPVEFYHLLKLAMLTWSRGELPTELLTESWSEFELRVKHALSRICQQRNKHPTLIVSSGGVISMLLGLVLELAPRQAIELNMQVKNTGFSHFYFNQSNVRLSSFNNTPHLERLDRPNAITFS